MAAMQRAAMLASPLLTKEFFTEAEYFAHDAAHGGHWEFRPVPEAAAGRPGMGEIRTMGGGLPSHAEVAGNLIRILGDALRALGNRFCHVYTSDLKVHCADGLNTYPDVTVVCGKPTLHAGRRDIVTNALLVCEVLSPSTEAGDRGEKWRSYQTIPTLRHYLLASAAEPRVELFTRQDYGEWRRQIVDNAEGEFDLSALAVRLSMADLYDMVDMEL